MFGINALMNPSVKSKPYSIANTNVDEEKFSTKQNFITFINVFVSLHYALVCIVMNTIVFGANSRESDH